jgi:hypothetical protein
MACIRIIFALAALCITPPPKDGEACCQLLSGRPAGGAWSVYCTQVVHASLHIVACMQPFGHVLSLVETTMTWAIALAASTAVVANAVLMQCHATVSCPP